MHVLAPKPVASNNKPFPFCSTEISLHRVQLSEKLSPQSRIGQPSAYIAAT